MCFYFLLYLKIFIIKNCWIGWYCCFGRLKIIFSSGTISSFSFSFSITISSSSIRQSPLIVCVRFVPTFDEVLAVFVPTFDEVLAGDGPFGKKCLANSLSSGGRIRCWWNITVGKIKFKIIVTEKFVNP